MQPSLKATGPQVIDIWTWSLDAPAASLLSAMLTEEEMTRAAHFVFQRDRLRFIAGRAGLRLLLSRYLGIPPRRLGLTCNVFGKPKLAASNKPPLHFNLSHSGATAVLAVSDHYEVGIDIEEIKPLAEDVASYFFSPKECMALKALPPGRYLEAFYRCWTRKEAFVKAHGAGLSLPLDAFDVTVDATRPPRLERLDGDARAPHNWSLFQLRTPFNLAGAVAALTVGNSVSLRYRSENAPDAYRLTLASTT